MLNLSPHRHELRRTITQAERLDPPDDAGGWVLVDFRPFPLPSPEGMGLALVCLWVRELCCKCRRPFGPGERGAESCPEGLICSHCLEATGGPLQAAQLCPICDGPLPQPVDRKLAPYCSGTCQSWALADGPDVARAVLITVRREFGAQHGEPARVDSAPYCPTCVYWRAQPPGDRDGFCAAQGRATQWDCHCLGHQPRST